MNFIIKTFLTLVCATPFMVGEAFSARCSTLNFTKCLDSACAKNIGANPAARCQLCGTASAGDAASSSVGLRSLSLGANSKTTISDSELKDAPAAPGERYIWATRLCIEKNEGCTPDDATKNYDKLIEQSCNAALNTARNSSSIRKANVQKTQSTCSGEIYSCITATSKCGESLNNCNEDTEFNKHFNACQIIATGCEAFATGIKSELTNLIDLREESYTVIAKAYQEKRVSDETSTIQSCENDTAFNKCVEQICESGTRNKCAPGFEDEKQMAVKLCDFHKTACELLEK